MGRRDEEDKNKIRRRKAASSNSNSSNSSSSSNNTYRRVSSKPKKHRKSNKGKIIGVILGVVAVVGVIVFAGMKFDLLWKVFNRAEISSSKEVVENFLDNYSKQDEQAFEYLNYASEIESLNFDGYTGKLAKGISYEIKSVSREDDNIVVKIIINNYDMKTIFENLQQQNLADENEMISYIDTVLESKDAPKKDYECYAYITNQDDVYKVIMTDTLSNGLFGGLNEYISELSNL